MQHVTVKLAGYGSAVSCVCDTDETGETLF
jgi:hypothetical protein